MEETRPHQTRSSRLGLRHAAGEIVEVQGGHIVRSTGRKDRHSKVCTAKGTRDRRVRLSAHTAIQFYDVQDRLGYDRPSKAVDWLIKKSKAAIDELAELPAWKPPSGSTANVSFDQAHGDGGGVVEAFAGSSSRRRATNTLLGTDIQNQQQQQLQMSNNPSENNPNFLPPSLDSDSFSDTIKSFFPMGVSAEETNSSSPMQFQNFPPPDLLSRTSSQSQNLRLSLQSFQDTILVHHHHQQPHHQSAAHQIEQGLFFETGTPAGWSSDQPAEISRFQRMVAWNAGGETSTGGGGRGFIFNSPQMPPLFVQNQFLSQGGTLQSSNNSPSFRA